MCRMMKGRGMGSRLLPRMSRLRLVCQCRRTLWRTCGQMEATRRCMRRNVLRIVERCGDVGHQRHWQVGAMMMMQSSSGGCGCRRMVGRRRMGVVMMMMVVVGVGGGCMMRRRCSRCMMMMMMQLGMQLRLAWTALMLNSCKYKAEMGILIMDDQVAICYS